MGGRIRGESLRVKNASDVGREGCTAEVYELSGASDAVTATDTRQILAQQCIADDAIPAAPQRRQKSEGHL